MTWSLRKNSMVLIKNSNHELGRKKSIASLILSQHFQTLIYAVKFENTKRTIKIKVKSKCPNVIEFGSVLFLPSKIRRTVQRRSEILNISNPSRTRPTPPTWPGVWPWPSLTVKGSRNISLKGTESSKCSKLISPSR